MRPDGGPDNWPAVIEQLAGVLDAAMRQADARQAAAGADDDLSRERAEAWLRDLDRVAASGGPTDARLSVADAEADLADRLADFQGWAARLDGLGRRVASAPGAAIISPEGGSPVSAGE
jgi:hypothetical protein